MSALLHTGPPGSGKTTALRRAAERLRGRRLGGFYPVDVWLVDEIGKMECLSPAFVVAMRMLLDGRIPIVATVALRGAGFIDAVKRRPDAEVRTLTRATREAVPDAIVEWIARAGDGRAGTAREPGRRFR